MKGGEIKGQREASQTNPSQRTHDQSTNNPPLLEFGTPHFFFFLFLQRLEDMDAAMVVGWGTWEELILGGAVLRHGTHSWNAVASELRSRSPFPHLFTPEECEAKYDDLQQRFSGCDTWFEELRKQRVAELKRELEKSEDSIGSLQSKLENLTSEREGDSKFLFNTTQTESISPIEDGYGVGIDSSSKEISKDGSSAGSFTEKTGKDWSFECPNLGSVPTQHNDHNTQPCRNAGKQQTGCGCSGVGFGNFKRKRGKRKRKGCDIGKDGSAGESEALSSSAFMDIEGSSEGCNQDVKAPCEELSGSLSGKNNHVDFEGIINSFMEHKEVSIFRRRLESQKRSRYKKMIRRHVDFQNISLRMVTGLISSAKELFRDLLLLCNNALVFYPKNSSEHKSALILRDLVMESLRKNPWNFPLSRSGDQESAVSVEGNTPRKLQNAQAASHSVSKDTPVAGKGDEATVRVNGKKGWRADAAVGPPGRKRRVGRPAKGGQRGGRRRQESPNKGRKRARR